MVTVGKLLLSALFSAFGAAAAGAAASGVAAAAADAGLTMIPTPDPPSPVPSCTSGPVFRAPVIQELVQVDDKSDAVKIAYLWQRRARH